MIQETIRTPVWFAAFWVEASADPNAQDGVVAIRQFARFADVGFG